MPEAVSNHLRFRYVRVIVFSVRVSAVCLCVCKALLFIVVVVFDVLKELVNILEVK